MKLISHVILCLLLSSISFGYAAHVDNPVTENKNETKEERARLEVIPNTNLEVQLSHDGTSLDVELEGNTGKLDWIIFKPKGEVISRIKTDSKIDKIKINTLKKGTYVLMVKDDYGRVIATAFNKV